MRRGSPLAVVYLLLAASVAGMAGMLVGGLALQNPAVLEAAVALGLTAGMLGGVALARAAASAAASLVPPEDASDASSSPGRRHASPIKWLPVVMAGVGGTAISSICVVWRPAVGASLLAGGGTALLALLSAGLALTAASYLRTVDPVQLPEAAGMSQGARLLFWILVSAAASVVLQWAGKSAAVQALMILEAIVMAIVCLELFAVEPPADSREPRFHTELRLFALLGSRTNPLASALDAAQRELGIDLRSTWALNVVRRTAEPMLVGLLVIGWAATAATVVGLDEQGLIERLGVPTAGPPLEPGLHLHWPWPVDRVLLIPVRKIQVVNIGHETAETRGPESVLWARAHGGSPEYTLLLGNGRDLISIDMELQFRISDARAWRYHCANPRDALRAIAYRAVMKSTVSRTLAQALSENVARLARQMRATIQADADALGLGVTVVALNVGALHPPVEVATDYQAVVSAELTRTTASIRAQAFRNATVPHAFADVFRADNAARAEAVEARARATGAAWSFRALESGVRTAPGEFRFRRRLETLEAVLSQRRFTVVDARIGRDGGELWLMK